MNKTRLLVAGASLVVASAPLFTSEIPLPLKSLSASIIYRAHQSFLHEIGVSHPYGWEAFFQVHHPGYLVKGLRNGGDHLPTGTYQYNFFFALRPGHLTSLLSGANDVARLEVADKTTGDILMERTFQMADFQGSQKKLIMKSLMFSTWERGDHFFEPRVYWPGLSGIFLQRVELIALEKPSLDTLKKKASDFEAMMSGQFLDHGFVIVRNKQGHPEDVGDTAIWTGLYAAAEALRYQATQEPESRKQMEQSLWALHSLAKAAPLYGTIIRHLDSNGQAGEQPASKDTYTGFFYGVSQALPYVRDPTLKKALLTDLASIGDHLLDHDLAFDSSDGVSLDFNPYLGPDLIREAVRDLNEKSSTRRDVIKTLRIARWYFWVHGQRPPPSFARIIRDLKHPSTPQLQKEILPFLNDLRAALKTLQHNVHRSALRGSREGLNDTPYIKLDVLLLKALSNLDADTRGRPLTRLEDLKVLPSQSLNALHFLKVTAEFLPKPNRFDTYYHANLFEGKALLRTAIQWHQIDEEALTAVVGQSEADTKRTASSHVSYLALHDLILLEKDPIIRFKYQKLFEAQYQPMRSDGNAMIDAMHAAVGLSSKQLGLAWWSLERYPIDRRGKGDRYWQENRQALLAAFGGELNGQARNPLPPDLRPRDAFLWQRSAHSIRGDQEGWLYPPLDYLFAYWLARNAMNKDQLQNNKADRR